MGTTSDLYTGFASRLDSAGIGKYRPDTAFQAGETAITEELMPNSPDRAVVLNLFPLTENPVMPSGRWMLQVRTRGLPNMAGDAGDLADAVTASVHGLIRVDFGATHIIQVLFYTSVTLGNDEHTRFTRSTRFWVDVDEAPTILRPDGGAWD